MKFKQLSLLLWKIWILQKRKVCVTVFEIGMPIFFAVLLLLIRAIADSDEISNPTKWPSFKPNAVINANETDTSKTEVLFYPNNSLIQNIVSTSLLYLPKEQVTTYINRSSIPPIRRKIEPTNWTFVGFDSETGLLAHQQQHYGKVRAAVVFDPNTLSATVLPKKVHYTLRVARLNSNDQWRTRSTFPFFQTTGYRNNDTDGGDPNYQKTTFLALQFAINNAIILQQQPSAAVDDVTVSLQKMAYPPFRKDYLITVLQQNLPQFFLLGFIVAALQTAKNIVYEKERKLKEGMLLMGLNPVVYWLSWFIKSIIYLGVANAVYAILFAIPIGDKGKVLPKTDPSLFYCFMLLYSISIIAYCFMISTFFKKASAAGYGSGIIFYLTYAPYFFLQQRYETMSRPEKMLASLLNNLGMALGVNSVGIYEGTGEGAQWSNFMRPATVDDNFSLGDSMLMLAVDSVLYCLIAWYMENVFPGEYGIPLPWYFPFTKWYWCGTPISGDSSHDGESKTTSKYFEKEPSDLKAGISIRNLRKVFGSGKNKKVAVANTSLNMYEGQITALLGHNGAGKTTTMSMLSGFLPPTSGTASVNGYDIRTDIQGVRKSLGLCPQHNILFDNMTVDEHLRFFAELKGCPKKEIRPAVSDMIKVLGLQSKAHRRSHTLSGGQKRKLSLGIALIAGSKVVILDEPTSGMDPAARRQTWDILQKYREGRTLVLSTHFMDEADLLGDRIAIMAEGVVKCCGTSLFLKKLFGAGYHLIMVKDVKCNVAKVTALIQRHIAAAELESDISAELTYLLPFNESHKFENLFLDIEKCRNELGLTSFGTSATTLEEVFLKVGETNSTADDDKETNKKAYVNHSYAAPDKKEENEKSPSIIPDPAIKDVNGYSVAGMKNGDVQLKHHDNGQYIGFNSDLKKNTGVQWTMQQFWGMMVKKFIHTWRNRTISLIQLLLPVIFTILALATEKTIPKPEDEPALNLNLDPFSSVTTVVSAGATPNTLSMGLSTNYSETFANQGYTVENTTADMEEYLLNRAMGVGIATFKKRYVVAGDFQPDTPSNVSITAFFNEQPFHSVAISLGIAMDTCLKYFTDSSYSISTTNHPFPRSLNESSRGIGYATRGTGFVIAFFILFGMAFLSSSFIIFLIKERASGAKHCQKVSGVSSYVFWLSNLAWDMINYLVPALLILVCFAAFQTTAYTGDNRLGLIFVMLMLYGWACMPFVYMMHYLFSLPSTGMVTVTMINIISGLATLMAVFVLKIPDLNVPEIVGDGLDWLFMVFLPNYCLGQALMNFYTNYEYEDLCVSLNYKQICADSNVPVHPCCPEKCSKNCFLFDTNYLAWDLPGTGRYFLFMSAQGLVYFVFVLMIEFGVFQKLIYKICKSGGKSTVSSMNDDDIIEENEDIDVAEERKRINQTSLVKLMTSDALILQSLRKTYGNFMAVKDICVGVPKQECFGLLGQNGAGKTSTFKMLTGDTTVTSGNAYLNTNSIKYNLTQVQQSLGYCPQFDALIEQMTGRETLTLYARLRGIRESQIKEVVNELLDTMMLKQYADKQCGTYSGGNKRKLNTAIALIGDPPFVLLDEPTTGMDPGARRQLWNVLSNVRASGRTLILTSHSMEECDALCTKIVIMVNGRFVCYGSPQHLKNRFGHGYTLIVRLGMTETGEIAPSAPLKQFITDTFPGSQIFDNHIGYLDFQIPDSDIPLAKVFGEMERQAKVKYHVEDYSVHQTTLEQVFLTFTKSQIQPPDTLDKGCSCNCSKFCCLCA